MRQQRLAGLVACLAVGTVTLARPTTAAADGNGAIGYAFLKYLEEGGGSTPLGAFLSLHGTGGTTLELDLGYHRDTESSITLNTFTALAGPRFTSGFRRTSVPFLHVLGGVRHDRVESGESNTAFGGLAGIGVDLRTGSLGLRLGADFQIFFDEGESLKTLRLGVGFTF